MKRINEQNVNTVSHWNEVYSHPDNQFWDDIEKFKFISTYIENGESVIDLGCGQGFLSKQIKLDHQKSEVWGLDFSRDVIEQNTKDIPECKFVYGNVYDTGIKRKFDCVTCLETIEHLEEPEMLVKEMARLTKNKAILTTPYLDHIPSDEHLWEFDYEDLDKMFRKYFKSVWVFPLASGRCVYQKQTHKMIYPPRNWDQIIVVAKNEETI